VVAQGAENVFADPVTWINFGVLGLLALGLITGWLWPKHAVERIIREKEKAEAQRDAMAEVLQDKLLPVVGDFITTTQVLLPILQDIHRRRLYGDSRDPPEQRSESKRRPARRPPD
jgi:hypothetical protein